MVALSPAKMQRLQLADPRFAPRRAAEVRLPRPLTADEYAEARAWERHRRHHAVQNSFLTGTVTELIEVSRADYTAHANSTSEVSLIAGPNLQPTMPAGFLSGIKGYGKTCMLIMEGVVSTTGTPTIIFTIRTSSTQGTATVNGTTLGVTAAITTQNGLSNDYWRLEWSFTVGTPGQGTNNATLIGSGYTMSPQGWASPFIYPIEPSTPDTATWTATIDAALTQYINVTGTWSAASASNTITCKRMMFLGLN